MKPAFESPLLTIHQGNCLEVLAGLPDSSVQCCVTSPPYWGLRDYGIPPSDWPAVEFAPMAGLPPMTIAAQSAVHGLEKDPWSYVAHEVAIFREVRRVLRDDGLLWLNLGDTFFTNGVRGSGGKTSKQVTNAGSFFDDKRPNPSPHGQRVPACGTDGKVPQDLKAYDCVCSCLCDECRDALGLFHTENICPLHAQSVSLASPTIRGSEHSGSSSATQSVLLPVVQGSTTQQSSQQLQGECLRCSRCGVSLSVLRSLAPDAQGCVHNSCLNNTIVQPQVNLKPKDLCGIPWRVAFALQADGWYLRSDVIWHKPNPMPESVTDRCTKAHEYLFMFAKSERYYFDAEAIKESGSERPSGNKNKSWGVNETTDRKNGEGLIETTRGFRWDGSPTRNRRDVWTVTTNPYPEAHFATFPPALITPCILAGSRTAGKRCDCDEIIFSPTGNGEINDPSFITGRAGMNRPRRDNEGTRPVTRRSQREWAEQLKSSPHRKQMEEESGAEAFAHYIRTDESGARPPRPDRLESWLARGWLKPATPCDCPIQEADTILDPFGGSGTTGQVANELGRKTVLIDMNPKYIEMQLARTNTTPGLALT